MPQRMDRMVEKKNEDMYLQSFQCCSVNKVVGEDHNKMLFTL